MEQLTLHRGHSRSFVPKHSLLLVQAGAVAYANGEDYGVSKRSHKLNPGEPVTVVGLAPSSLVVLDDPKD